MGCPVRELQYRMSSSEFAQWAAFDRIEPIGFNGFNYHFSTLTATVANSMGGKKSGGQFSPMDFAYLSADQQKKNDAAESKAVIKRMMKWNESCGINSKPNS